MDSQKDKDNKNNTTAPSAASTTTTTQEGDNDFDDILKVQTQTQTQTQTQQKDSKQKAEVNDNFDNVLEYQGEKAKKFDLSQFLGYDQQRFNAWYGSIADRNGQIQAALSQLTEFKIPFNVTGDKYYPRWELETFYYNSVTKAALDERQTLMAEVDDLTRTVQATNLRLQEMAQELRDRQALKTEPSPSNSRTRSDIISNTAIDKLQENIKELQKIPEKISQELTKKKIQADWLAMKIYFHVTDYKVFENLRGGDQLDNILKACDLKQLGLPLSVTTSSGSQLQGVRQGTG